MTQEINNECWRNISDYLTYQVSNVGRVRNSKTGRIMKPFTTTTGYFQIGLCKEGKQKLYQIHRLVAQAFIENPDNKKIVDHVNHKITDNTILNLRWVSSSENQMNRTKQQITSSSKYKGVSFNKACNKWHARLQLNKHMKHIGFFANEKEAAAKYNESAIELSGRML